MKQSRFREEQIIGVLKEGEAGVAVKELSRKHGICDQTYYRWKAKYGGLVVSAALAEPGRGEPAAEADGGRAGAGHSSVAGGAGKKVLTPTAQREAVGVMQAVTCPPKTGPVKM